MRLDNFLKLSLLSLLTSNMIYAKDSIQRIETVTVVANKVEENIQRVPQSITIIDDEAIEEKGIKNIANVINEIPNMYINPEFGGAMNFRGLNTSFFTFNNPIIIYIDGIATSDTNSFDASMQNIERIEVLRGPQGTLYGKDAIGGVINIITKEPDNIRSGSIGFEYGSNNYMSGTFNLNTPLIEDILFFNINGTLSADDGWINNVFNQDNKAAKKSNNKFSTLFLYKINDNLSAKLILKKEKSKKYWGNYDGKASATNLSEFSRDSVENTSFDTFTLRENEIDSQALNIKYETNRFTIESISTHKKSDLNTQFDPDFQSGTAYDGISMVRDIDMDTYTQELRVSNKENDNFRWITGLYFEDEDIEYNPYSMSILNSISKTDVKTKAIFAQAMIPLDERIELTLGGRYQKVEKKIDLNHYIGNTNDFNLNAQKNWNTFLPKIALSYKLNDNLTSYISASKGYMPGGFNTFTSSGNSDTNSFESQKSTNFEVGLKGSFNNFLFSASIFRMNIKDIHVYRQISGAYYTDNAEKAHSQGIEFDFTYFPTDTLEIGGAFGFIDTEYDSFNAGDYNFSGNKIEQTPSHTAKISLTYHNPNGFYTRADIKNQGSLYFYDDVQKDFLKNDAYTTIDLKLGYKFQNWNIYGFVNNLTDEEYITYYQSSAAVSVSTFGDQRTIGMGIRYTF